MWKTYIVPLQEIIMDHPFVKAALGVMVALFATDPMLLAMIFFASVIDTVFGSMAAYDKDDFDVKKVFGGLIAKLIRYGLVIALLVMPINVFAGQLKAFIPVIFGVLWANEAVSVIKHIKDPALKKSVQSIFNAMKRMIGVKDDSSTQ